MFLQFLNDVAPIRYTHAPPGTKKRRYVTQNCVTSIGVCQWGSGDHRGKPQVFLKTFSLWLDIGGGGGGGVVVAAVVVWWCNGGGGMVVVWWWRWWWYGGGGGGGIVVVAVVVVWWWRRWW